MKMKSNYAPHSEETKQHYEDLLQEIRRCTPPGIFDGLEEVANDVLSIVCAREKDGQSIEACNSEKQRQLESLFETSLSRSTRDKLLRFGRLITDFVEDSSSPNESGTGDIQDDQPRFEFDEHKSSSSSDDEADAVALLTGNITQKQLKHFRKSERKKMNQYAFDATVMDEDDNADGFLHEEGGQVERKFLELGDGLAEEKAAIPFEDVACNSNYLKDCLRRLFPSQSADVCSTQAQKVFEYLSAVAVDTLTVETQLTAFLGGYDDEAVMEWIGEVCASRWEIVYGLGRAQAKSEKERLSVMAAMEKHALEDSKVENLFQRITGKEVDRLQKRSTGAAEEGGKGGFEGDRRPLRRVDIESCVFLDERRPHKHKKATVPPGTQKVVYETHDEVVLPPSVTRKPTDSLVAIESLPQWCRSSFGNIEYLNAMQSKAFKCAFESDENMLISAPTGAGKTNVALLAMLRAVRNAMDPNTGTIRLRELKMVYVAPMKALVQEVVRTFTEKLSPLGLQVAELSGDTATTQAQLMNTQLIVATPEKWDIVTRKSVELGVASLLKLLIIDEVHLLHNERGSVLEAIVSRTFLQQQFRGQGGIRLVGLSATLPNWQDVASFLQVDKERALFVFDSSYRPIPLEQTFCAVKKVHGKTHTATMNSVVYDKVMEAIERGEQSLVFVHSRKDTVFTAKYLQSRAHQEHRSDSIVVPGGESERVLREETQNGSLSAALQQLLPQGFGVHHAGLGKEERALVESLFADRHLKVLVCTSTLAWGVNLPANQVIIKGTRVFNSSKGESELLSALDVLQMFGRAGRAGFGYGLGRAAIITSEEDANYYLCVLNEQLPIESHLMKRVVDMLNAEIVLGHIENTAEGVKWLQRTYLYVRLRQIPELYGARKSNADPLFLHHLECIVHTCCEELKSAKMVHYDAQTRRISPTSFGRIASFCYVSAQSMLAFLGNLSNMMQDTDLFRVFALSSEFSQVAVRADEQTQLRELLESAPIAVKDSRYTSTAKINILLQCYISRKSLEGLPLMSEIGYVKDSAQRILRALYEICLQKEFGRTARQYLELYLMVLHQQWSVESPIRQVESIMSVKDFNAVLPVLDRVQVPWSELRLGSADDWGQLLTDDRRAEMVHNAVKAVPHYYIEASVRPLTRSMLYVDIDITPEFVFYPEFHSPAIRVTELLLLVEHTNGRILHYENILLPLQSIEEQWTYSCPPIVVPMTEPRPTHLIVRCISPHWLHAGSTSSVSLMNTLLPTIAPPLREVSYQMRGEEDELEVGNVLSKYGLQDVATQFFPFPDFYLHQRELVETIMESHESLFVGLPPGAGKTTLAELFTLEFILSSAVEETENTENSKNGEGTEEDEDARDQKRKTRNHKPTRPKLLYLTVHEEVADRRYMDWSYRFGSLLKTKVVKLNVLNNDSENLQQFDADGAQIIVTTGSSLLQLIRREEKCLLSDVTHIVVDHVHLVRSSEGRSMEECVARLLATPYIVGNGSKKARLLALSYPLISAVEVCRWLRITSSRQYNYSNSCRQLRVRVEGLDLPSCRSRYETGVIAALKLVLRPQNVLLPSVIFVPTERDAEEVAMRVILRCREEVPEEPMENVENPKLALLLAAGVGFLHRDISPLDEIAILEKLDTGVPHPTTGETRPLLLVCSFGAAGRLPAASFHIGIVTTTERSFHGLEATAAEEMDVINSLSAAELLQIVSRAAQETVVFCPMARRWVWSKLMNEPLPLESSLRYPLDFADSINAAVANGRVRTKVDVLRVLQMHYFLYHLKSNPHFYGVSSDEDIPRYASELTARIVKCLVDRGCIRVEGEKEGQDNPRATLHSLSRGIALAEYSVGIESVEAIDEKITAIQETSMVTASAMWRVITSCCQELSPGSIGDIARCGDANELDALFSIAHALPEKYRCAFVDLNFKEEGIKLFLLVLAYCAGFFSSIFSDGTPTENEHPFQNAKLPPEELVSLLKIPLEVAVRLENDLRSVFPLVFRVLHGVVRLLIPSSKGGPWPPVRCLMYFVQCVQTQSWTDAANNNSEIISLKANGAAEELDHEMMITVQTTVQLQPLSLTEKDSDIGEKECWWLSCVLREKNQANQGSDHDGRVVTVDEVSVFNNKKEFEHKLLFPLSALDELDLDALDMVIVLSSQRKRINVETVVLF